MRRTKCHRPPTAKASCAKPKQSKAKKWLHLWKLICFSLFSRGLFLKRKGRAMQVSLPEFKHSKHKQILQFPHHCNVSMSNSDQSYALKTRSVQLNTKLGKSYGSGPYPLRIDLFSNERKRTVLSAWWLTPEKIVIGLAKSSRKFFNFWMDEQTTRTRAWLQSYPKIGPIHQKVLNQTEYMHF